MRVTPARTSAAMRLLAMALLGVILNVSASSGQTRLDARLLPERQTAPAVSPGFAMIASAALPGTGQYLLGRDRWVPFAAIEVWAWLTVVSRRLDARDLAAQYRDLAWTAARRVSVGERIDPAFEYYESMSHFEASGLLDADPRIPGIQPEIDTRTYNGEQWQLARSLYFPGGLDFPPGTPEYQRAMDYYIAHAIGPALTWAWGDRVLEQQTFRELIRQSDEKYRSATQVLGLILVNHLVSAIDALILGRTERIGASRIRFESRLERDFAASRLDVRVRIPW